MHPRFLIATLLMSCAVGCESAQSKIPRSGFSALERAKEFELLSLNPEYLLEPPEGHFHGYEVLGRTHIKDNETRRRLIDEFNEGAAESDGTVADCFNPRHGIRAVSGESSTDFVICFECSQVQIHAPDGSKDYFSTTDSPQRAFDDALRAAEVPLPNN